MEAAPMATITDTDTIMLTVTDINLASTTTDMSTPTRTQEDNLNLISCRLLIRIQPIITTFIIKNRGKIV